MLHSWKDTLDYSDNTMELVRGYEKTVNEFFLSVKHFMRTCPGTGVAAFAKWGPEEVALQVFGCWKTAYGTYQYSNCRVAWRRLRRGCIWRCATTSTRGECSRR